MATITGKWTSYNKIGGIKDVEEHSIEADIGDIVRFQDNSYLGNCYINIFGTSQETKSCPYIDATGAYTEGYGNGKIVKTDSMQYAEDNCLALRLRRVEMPIAVICDNGEILYCNPLNIQVI